MRKSYVFKTKRLLAIGERFLIAKGNARYVFMVAGVGVLPGVYWVIPVENV